MNQQSPDLRKLARSQWRELAESYIAFRESADRYNDLLEVPAMRELLGDVAGRDVLDAGCGTGVHARYCARRGARVVGVDLSHRLLLEARKLADRESLDLALVEGDVENLGMFPAGRFDAVVSSVVLAFHLKRVFAEFHRVLRTGGRLLFSDLHPVFQCGRPLEQEGRPGLAFSGYFDRALRNAVDPFGEAPDDRHATLHWRHHTLGDYFEALAAGGFVVRRFVEPEPRPGARSAKADRARAYPVFFLIEAQKLPSDARP